MRWIFYGVGLLLVVPNLMWAAGVQFQGGVARVDVTPEGPIRLAGYPSRTGESEGVDQHLWAKALAIGTSDDDVSVLITLDATAVPPKFVDDVAAQLRDSGVARERLALCITHTNCGPLISGAMPNLFAKDLPADQLQRIQKYSGDLKEKLVSVAREAMTHRKAVNLAWGQGKSSFAVNDRAPNGPVDSALPLLRVTDAKDGTPLAVFISYACPSNTIGPEVNRICGDWAGYAQEQIENDQPGVTAMVAIGCAGDVSPQPRGTIELAKQHGGEIAAEVKRILATDLRPLTAPIAPKLNRLDLAFDKLPTREQWTELSKRTDAAGYNARQFLSRLQHGETIPTALPYAIQTWTFGDQLAMVFLSGEPAVDYSLRLKREFDPARLWVNGCSNGAAGYIPSRRGLAAGGDQLLDSMNIYAQPAPLAAGVEDDIVRAVHALLPDKLRTDAQRAEFPRPKSTPEAIDRFRLRNDLKIELVASEPMVQSPVAIDWGNDGRLWVAEMVDYPNGLNENGTAGGRICVLQDTDGDGKYDKSTIFLDGLRCPSGIMAWRKGVIICAAPDIIYAEDTDGDGRADVKKVLFTGFSPADTQWLPSSPMWGLDNWIYCASSGQNGPIRIGSTDKRVELGAHDFRFNPDTLALEPVAGHSQSGLARDDWGRWFGNDRTDWIFQIPLAEHYLHRNPHARPLMESVSLTSGVGASQVFGISRGVKRSDNPADENKLTSARGVCIYRGDALGDEFTGNAFTCEPAHNLVRRMILKPDGVIFNAEKSDEDKEKEFLASTDNWFRPVQARTGPDGALWIVDMYRFVIDDPRLMTPARLAEVDVRAGADLGRIYRIYPKDHPPRPIAAFSQQPTPEVAKLLDSANGTLRDAVHRELYQRRDPAAVPMLREIAVTSELPAARAQAICALDSFDALAPDLLEEFLRDPNPNVRAVAIRLSEPWLALSQSLTESLEPLVNDADLGVRYQLALSLGNWDNAAVPGMLGRIAIKDLNDPWVRAAIVSSANGRAVGVLSALRGADIKGVGRNALVKSLITTAASAKETGSPDALILSLLPSLDADVRPEHFHDLAWVLDAWPDDVLRNRQKLDAGARSRVEFVLEAARRVAEDSQAGDVLLAAAMPLLGREPDKRAADLQLLATILTSKTDRDVQESIIASLARTGDPKAADVLLKAVPKADDAVRAKLLDALCGRPQWAPLVLQAVKNRSIAASQIDDPHRKQLLEATNGAAASVLDAASH